MSTPAGGSLSAGVRPDRPNLPALTGLRFFAALWVVLFHFSPYLFGAFPRLTSLDRFADAGARGVDLFFALSGFILAYNYLGDDRLLDGSDGRRRFLRNRIARIYPVHLVTLLAVTAAIVLAGLAGRSINLPHTPNEFVQNVFLVHAWSVGDGRLNFNYPSWSVSAEWFAYLLFPLVMWLVAKVQRLGALVAMASLALAAELFVLQGLDYGPPLVRITGLFLAGAVLCVVHLRIPAGDDRDRWGASSLVVGAALVIWSCLPVSLDVRDLGLPLLFLALIGVLARADASRYVGPLETRTVVLLGEASYCLYMTHGIVELLGPEVLPVEIGAGVVRNGLALGFYAVAIVAATAATFLLVERPARDWIRGRPLTAG